VSRLPRQVKLFGAVSLLNDFASEMVYPLLPAFVTVTLGGGAAALGALDGAAEFTAALVKYGAGRAADSAGGKRRGPLIVLGYAVAVLVRPVIAATAAAWQVIGLRVVDRIGKGIRTPPRDALIADVTPPALLGRAFGLQRGFDHAGSVLGPLAAWALLSTGTADVRGVIAWSIVPGVLVLGLAMWAVKDGGRRSKSVEAVPLPSGRPAAWPSGLLVIAAFYLIRMPEALILLHAQHLGVALPAVPLLWAAVHVVKSAASFAGGAWSDRFGARRTMWFGWAAYAAVAAGFAVATSPAQAWALFLAVGVVAGLTESPERALVAGLAGGGQGKGFGTYHALTGLAALAGGILLGVAFQWWGASTAFLVSTGGGLALAALAPLLYPSPPQNGALT
jgi:MFS family permease